MPFKSKSNRFLDGKSTNFDACSIIFGDLLLLAYKQKKILKKTEGKHLPVCPAQRIVAISKRERKKRKNEKKSINWLVKELEIRKRD